MFKFVGICLREQYLKVATLKNSTLIPDKELDTLICETPSYVITYRSSMLLLKTVSFVPSCR